MMVLYSAEAGEDEKKYGSSLTSFEEAYKCIVDQGFDPANGVYVFVLRAVEKEAMNHVVVVDLDQKRVKDALQLHNVEAKVGIAIDTDYNRGQSLYKMFMIGELQVDGDEGCAWDRFDEWALSGTTSGAYDIICIAQASIGRVSGETVQKRYQGMTEEKEDLSNIVMNKDKCFAYEKLVYHRYTTCRERDTGNFKVHHLTPMLPLDKRVKEMSNKLKTVEYLVANCMDETGEWAQWVPQCLLLRTKNNQIKLM